MGNILLLVLWIAAYFVFFIHLRIGIVLNLSVALLLLIVAFVLAPRRTSEIEFSAFSMLKFRPATHVQLRFLGQGITEDPAVRVRVVPANTLLLAATLVISAGGIASLFSSPVPILERTDQLPEDAWISLVFLFLLCLFPVKLAMNWLGECWHLRFGVISMGFVTRKEHHFAGDVVAYEFRDIEGGFFGGTDRERQRIGSDNALLVFAASFNPDLNRPHCSFRFYRFVNAAPLGAG